MEKRTFNPDAPDSLFSKFGLVPVSEEEARLLDSITDDEMRRATILGSTVGFFECLRIGDYFTASQELGILRYLKADKIDYYSGLLQRAMDDKEGAIATLESLSPASEERKEANLALISLYVDTGNYIKLDTILNDPEIQMSPVTKIYHRIMCLTKMSLDSFIGNFEEIRTLEIEKDDPSQMTEKDWHNRFLIAQIFSYCLITSGDMISQCLRYKRQTELESVDFENNPDTILLTKHYKRLTYILGFSNNVNLIQFSDSPTGKKTTLANIALAHLPWEKKLEIFPKSDHQQFLIKIAMGLYHPKLHPHEMSVNLVRGKLETIIHAWPHNIQAVIESEFSNIEEIVKGGDKTLLPYLGFALCDIITLEKDPYSIKNKIEKIISSSAYDTSELLQKRELANSMTEKAFFALQNAESIFTSTKNSYYGIGDASPLALMYFRIIEMEYGAKLIKPLMTNITDDTLDKLKDYCGVGKKWAQREESEKTMSKVWENEIDIIDGYKNRNRSVLEIGKIRILIRKIREKNDSCSLLLLGALQPTLTNAGTQAWLSGRMEDVISRSTVAQYRNPGAHTGYLSYSGACKARDYVVTTLPEIEKWFTERGR